MKKSLLVFAVLPLLFTPVGCSDSSSNGSSAKEFNRLHFEHSEYKIHSGEAVTVKENYDGIVYSFAGAVPVNTFLNSTTGRITFDESTPNHSQVLLVASYEDMQSDPAVITLLQNNVTTELYFHTPIKNLIDGDYVLASSTNKTAITYSLESPVIGVSIDSMSGRVSYSSAAHEGDTFTVVASSVGQSIKENYFVTVDNLAVSATKEQAIEIGSGIPATYVLDFSNTPSGTEESVLSIIYDDKQAEESLYTYDSATHALVIDPAFLETLKTGENKIKIVTPRNMITVKLIMVTKFIRTPHDLQSINDNRDSLAGYYILENDIDLTDYLSKGGEGYNDNRGWNQIGIYHDLENDPTRDSFTGTFDGNGYTISGYFENRADDLAHNEGLFGYTTNQALIKNVGFVGSDSNKTVGRNFIGGFVGFNEGTIENCWSNVNISNKHEDRIFHSVGAFAGANTGIIRNCYTLGTPIGDTNVGAFVGKNFGEIKNCYSLSTDNNPFCGFISTGSNIQNSDVFLTPAAMNTFDYSQVFDSEAWDFNPGALPSLKHNSDVNLINGLEIKNKNVDYYYGETVELEVALYPTRLESQYLDDVVYTVENIASTGIVQNDNKFDTTNAVVDKFTVTASLHTEHFDFADSIQFNLNVEVETIELIDDFPNYVEPGKQYRFDVNITPSNADSEISWEVLGGKYGAAAYSFFKGNVLTITEEIMNYHSKETNPTFTVKGTAKNGKYVTKELTLKRIKYLGNKYCTEEDKDNITQGCLNFYKDTIPSNYIEFILPSAFDFGNFSVYKFSKKITVTRSGNKIRIPVSHITDLPNRQITFTFRTKGGDAQVIYRGYACYIDHGRYTINDVPTQYITLNNASDFLTYFRMTLDDNDETKRFNYDKTFVITNDIDFNGVSDLVSIGYESSSAPNSVAFSGTIYGFGHTIKNATFHYSERYFYYGPTTDPAKINRDPNTNNVGFFGFFSGKVYDLVFDNIRCLSYNYGGLFAGRILAGGYLEDVIIVNSKTMSTYTECDYTIDDLYQGRVASRCGGTLIGVTYDGTAVGLIGAN